MTSEARPLVARRLHRRRGLRVLPPSAPLLSGGDDQPRAPRLPPTVRPRRPLQRGAGGAPTLTFPAKRIRAIIINEYVRRAGYRGCVCFSCGNASAELRRQGLYVVDVSPSGQLVVPDGGWWNPAEIHRCWPDLFDATSGHLPVHLMVVIARAYRLELGPMLSGGIEHVPTGSGETITCLRWAYPHVTFVPVSDGTPATAQDPRGALIALELGR